MKIHLQYFNILCPQTKISVLLPRLYRLLFPSSGRKRDFLWPRKSCCSLSLSTRNVYAFFFASVSARAPGLRRCRIYVLVVVHRGTPWKNNSKKSCFSPLFSPEKSCSLKVSWKGLGIKWRKSFFFHFGQQDFTRPEKWFSAFAAKRLYRLYPFFFLYISVNQ